MRRALSIIFVFLTQSATGLALDASIIRKDELSLARLYSDPTLKSHEGRDFLLYRYVSNSTATEQIKLLMQAGVHGNELVASEFVIWAAERVKRADGPLAALIRTLDAQGYRVTMDFYPFANPDGIAKNTRLNSRGVNLNRNFATLWGISRENPGKTPFSENETRAVKALLDNESYDASVDVHGYVNWVVAPSRVTETNDDSTRESLYRAWTKSLANNLREMLPSYELKTGAQLGDGGAFEDWAFWTKNSLAYCLELVASSGIQPIGLTLRGMDEKERRFSNYEKFVARNFRDAVRLKKTTAPLADTQRLKLPSLPQNKVTH